MQHYFVAGALALLILSSAVGCGLDLDRDPELFERLSSNATGIAFSNDLAEDSTFNILNYLYYYNGGGVAAGDVNGDDLVDLYFTANEGPNALYLNRGDFQFEDVTAEAGVAGTGNWTTGVTMADVNGDGRLDIYVCGVGGYLDRNGRNQLFINQGDGTFTEEAGAYGLDFSGYGTQASFFDYDLDGDLDAFLLNHSTHRENTYQRAEVRYERNPRTGDRLYRNDGNVFTDVSEEAGIFGGIIGYGLSAAVSDLDSDGCPDVYVANDFHEDDYLYFNNCDGTFTEGLKQAMGHTSLAAMGSDAADFNNDGRMDVVVLDMMPAREDIRNTSASVEDPQVHDMKRSYGYHVQYPRNTLQLNRGRRRFSEIGYLAGVEATDWSWAPLFADLDNDGLKDLFITNGIYRRPNDLDYIEKASSEDVVASLMLGVTRADLELLDLMPKVPIPNFAFRNNGDLSFSDRAAAWGLGDVGFSNGAAYADLDNDGDLDLVVSNINEAAAVYENKAEELLDHHTLTIALEGSGANTAGIGAKVVLRNEGSMQVQELFPTRGFQSSVDPRLHFGLAVANRVDSVTVVWPGGRSQTVTDVAADQILTLHQDDADAAYSYTPTRPSPLFEASTLSIDYRHEENLGYDDFVREPLLPHRLSTEGPALAVGDVNGDGLDDVFAGGAKWQPAKLFLQQLDGGFIESGSSTWQEDARSEDVDASFFDADGDQDLDLYVVSGGNEFWGKAEALRDRLYLNDGSGAFARAEEALPNVFQNGSCVTPGDFDADGDVDLFVGSRAVSRYYGLVPRSVLLENDGSGRFMDVTESRADSLASVGMVTDAAWTDYNSDGELDLVVVGEWMPITVFEQQAGRFAERTAGLGRTNGWWNVVIAEDLDGDGDEDLIAGNLGLNSVVSASPEQPAKLYINDFDENGRLDQVLTLYKNGTEYPLASAELLLGSIVLLRGQYASFEEFGAQRIDDLFAPEQLTKSKIRMAYTFASTLAENQGDGTFTTRPLPKEAQLAPIFDVIADDVDEDGSLDLIMAGNFYGVTPLRGRYDASYGIVLRGSDDGTFKPMDPTESNLWIEGEVRRLHWINRADAGRALVVARNNDSLDVILRRPSLLTAR